MTAAPRPPVADIYYILRADNSLIVHFSGFTRGAGNGNPRYPYPDDLKNVVASGAIGGVSCSVVAPGDIFGTQRDANATGCVGVVLGLTSPHSLMDVHATDGGTHIGPDGVRHPRPAPITVNDVERTISGRRDDDYNEWVIGDYQILGIFIATPYAVPALVPISAPPGVPSYIQENSIDWGVAYTTVAEIRAEFPDLRLFTFDAGQILELAESVWIPAQHTSIY